MSLAPSVAARACPDDSPLIPARYHYFVRALDGAFARVVRVAEDERANPECSHHDADDEVCNDSPNEHFQQVLARGTRTPLTRRHLIRGGVGLAALCAVCVVAGQAAVDALGIPAVSLGAGGASI